MANDLNQCQFIGRLGKDPETRYMPDGGAVTNISLAVGSAWKDKASGEKKESTEWVRVVFFGKLAEIAGEYLKKGSQAFVSGSMKTREYEKDGVKKYSTEIVANNLQLLGGKPAGDQAERKQSAFRDGAGEAKAGGIADMDDDIPF